MTSATPTTSSGPASSSPTPHFPALTIRRLDTAERPPELIAQLARVWRSSVDATHGFVAPEDLDFFARFVPEAFRVVPVMYVAEAEGRVLGFAGIAADALEMLFVDADARGMGVGGRLLRTAIEAGVTKTEANEANDQARGFYDHFGFVVTGGNEKDGYGLPYPTLSLALG